MIVSHEETQAHFKTSTLHFLQGSVIIIAIKTIWITKRGHCYLSSGDQHKLLPPLMSQLLCTVGEHDAQCKTRELP